MEAQADPGGQGMFGRRWWQLVFGIVCMTMIANLQYGWTLFVNPMDAKFHWGRAAIQVAFTIFVLTETWLVPIEGYLVDRFGPRPVVVVGGILCAIAWAMNSVADSLMFLYVAAAIGGIGAGAVYGTCVGNAVKLFPDRRRITATLSKASERIQQARRDFRPLEMARYPVFWVMYLMFVLVAAGGLMATAQLAPIAKDFQIADIPVSILGLTLPALTFALSIDRVLNGLTRPFFGWVSDNIGRELTMLIAFGFEALGIFALYVYGKDPLMFVLLSGLVFFAWGEIYSLFPSTCTDTFGARYATANAGLLYTAKGTASLLVPLANVLVSATGNWHAVFVVGALLNAAAALLAWFVLRPMRSAHMGRISAKMAGAPAA